MWTGNHVTALICRVRTSKRRDVSRLNHTDNCRRQPRPPLSGPSESLSGLYLIRLSRAKAIQGGGFTPQAGSGGQGHS